MVPRGRAFFLLFPLSPWKHQDALKTVPVRLSHRHGVSDLSEVQNWVLELQGNL